jgi:hypothetical protein
MYMNYFAGYKWWHLPAMATLSATCIMLGAYLIAISQFGTNMVFMFRNLI